MKDKKFIFLAGHHRSGTSLLHEILREHQDITGLRNTNVPEDEGQHVQSIYKTANFYGGPGKYIFKKASYMNENHELVSNESANKIFSEWSNFFEKETKQYIEKSPPNLIRTRFLQALFPDSKFVVILRHPLAVSYATQKWTRTSTKSLIEHTLKGYEIFANDIEKIRSAYVLRYEDFVSSPQETLNKIFKFLELNPANITHQIRDNVNDKYFDMWRNERRRITARITFPVTAAMENRFNAFGYSIKDLTNFPQSNILSK